MLVFFPPSVRGGGIFSCYPLHSSGCAQHGAGASVSMVHGDPLPKLKHRPTKISFHSSQNLKFKRLHQWFCAPKNVVVFFPPVEVLLNKKVNLSFDCLAKTKAVEELNPIHDIAAPTSSDGYDFVTFGYFWRRASQIGQLPFRIHRKNEPLGLQPYCIHHLWRL